MAKELRKDIACTRCGGSIGREYSVNNEYEYVDVCLYCGYESVKLKDHYITAFHDDSIFLNYKTRSWSLGLKKYRKNHDDIPFQGDPLEIIKKNLAAAYNCLEVVKEDPQFIIEDENIEKIQLAFLAVFNAIHARQEIQKLPENIAEILEEESAMLFEN